MKPYYQNNSSIIYQGHALDILRQLNHESVQCVITSPPYWGLRNYETEPIIWDSWTSSGCDHEWGDEYKKSNRWGGIETISDKQASNKGAAQTARNDALSLGQFCQKCGAWYGSLGLEPTIDLYILHLTQIFHEVYRVLKKDGTFWLNLGDSYAGSGKGQMGNGQHAAKHGEKQHTPKGTLTGNLPTFYTGLNPKNICGIPWRVAFKLQEEEWHLRQDIIWHKPNPMPESVRDRCTKSHEYLFLLIKDKKYYYDAETIKEDTNEKSGWAKQRKNGINTWTYNEKSERNNQITQKWNSKNSTIGKVGKRNKRSVWTIPTKPYSGAHFAVFPEKLIEPCILAGSAIGDTILDPFSGSGTVLYVAQRYNRKGIGIELSPKYCDLSIERLKQQTLDFK